MVVQHAISPVITEGIVTVLMVQPTKLHFSSNNCEGALQLTLQYTRSEELHKSHKSQD